MDQNTVIFKLQLITLFDSICFGLLYAFLNPYLLVIGGDHLTVGILSVITLLCQLISKDIVKVILPMYGKQDSLFLILTFAVISHIMITLTSSCWFIICSSCIFYATNQANSICKDLLLKKIPKDETEYFLALHNILSLVGFIIGPLITGCLFSFGFPYSCFLAAALTFLNMYLVQSLPQDTDDIPSQDKEKPLVEKLTENLTHTFNLFMKSNYEKNWDLIALKFLFITSITIFFSKFTQILMHNFNSDSVVIGYTLSYQNGLGFAATYLIDNFKDKYESSTILLTRHALLVLLVCLIITCYSPIYSVYALMCVPMILSRCYLATVWAELFSLRKNQSLSQINESIGIVCRLTIPIIFGIVCNVIQHHAVVLFSVVPIILSLYIYIRYTIQYQPLKEDDSIKNKDD